MLQAIRKLRSPWWMVAVVCFCLVDLCGCSLFVMAGKMLQGDPVVESEFDRWYGKSLAKSGKNVAILCSSPESIKTEYSAIDLDLIAEMSSRLARNDIMVVKPHEVNSWIDDHDLSDIKQLALDLETNFVIHIKMDHFSYREDNSPGLLRGRSTGLLVVYELVSPDERGLTKSKSADSKKPSDTKNASSSKSNKKDKSGDAAKPGKTDTSLMMVKEVFSRNFNLTYPAHMPVSEEQTSPDVFRTRFVNQVAEDLARLFYRHKAGSDI